MKWLIPWTFAIVVLTSVPVFAGIQDWPEANPQVAFNAGESQRLWHRPENLVSIAKAWPIVRATITDYADELANPKAPGGILTLTHKDPAFETQATFYFNIKVVKEETRSVIYFRTEPGMWEETFVGLTPTTSKQIPTLSLPEGARSLWLLPPTGGHLVKVDRKYTLNLIAGDESLNGLITLPIAKADEFLDVQNGRNVRICGMEVLSPSSILWEADGEKHQWKAGDAINPPAPKTAPRPRTKEVRM